MIILPVVLPVIRQTYALPARGRHLGRTLSLNFLNIVDLHLTKIINLKMAWRLTHPTEHTEPAVQDKHTGPLQSLAFAAAGTGRWVYRMPRCRAVLTALVRLLSESLR